MYCKDCDWWKLDAFGEDGDDRECVNGKLEVRRYPSSPDGDGLFYWHPGGDCFSGFMTGATFGCIHFMAKESIDSTISDCNDSTCEDCKL